MFFFWFSGSIAFEVEARASLRLSFGRFTKDEDIDILINEITTKVPKLVEAGSMWNVR